MSLISTRCKEVFFRKHLRDHFQCSRNAVKDGYCKQHHPESRKALAIKNEARYNADILKRASTTDVRLSELELENAKLKAENAALKKEAVIAEKYGLSQAAEICRDAAVSFPISAYGRGFNDACRDNYNAILKVKDKP